MMQILDWFKNELINNNFFSGIVGGGILTSLIVLCKDIPLKLWTFFKRIITYSVIIRNDEYGIFQAANKVLGKNQSDFWIRTCKLFDASKKSVNRTWKPTDEFPQVGKTMADGSFIFWYKKVPLLVSRSSQTQNTHGIIETIQLSAILPFKKHLESFILDIEEIINSEKNDTKVFINRGDEWTEMERDSRKDFSDIVLPNGLKQKIINDLNVFLSKREFYAKHKLPYKRGYLFYGPPGTGKTSLALAIAKKSQWPIYLFNLANSNEDTFDYLAKAIKKNSVVVFEDVDAIQRKRGINRELGDTKSDDKNVSLSSLLNTIDGIAALQDCIIVMTTNHIGSLDDALLRDGRVDLCQELSYFDKEEASELFKTFYRNITEAEIDQRIEGINLPVCPANLQNIILTDETLYNEYEKN